jgi:stage III sporulation protein AD
MARRERAEFAVVISLAVSIFIALNLIGEVKDVLMFAERIYEMIPIDSTYLTIIAKMIGITYVAEFASAICHDAGCGVIAKQIQMFARIGIVALGIPVLSLFVEAVENFL